MATYANTGLAQSLAPWYGSCKIEISEDGGSTWVNVGLARAVKFEEQFDQVEIQSDNGPNLAEAIGNQRVLLTFNGLELYLPTMDKIRGGIDSLSVTSAIATTVTDSHTATEWAYNQVKMLSDMGSSSTGPAISAVKTWKTGSTTTLTTAGFDFVKSKDSKGLTNGIMVLSTDFGGDALDTETLRITYVYGDIAARKLTSGGKTTITSKMFRLTNKQVVSGTAKYRYIVLYSASLNAGLNLAFKSSNEADPVLEVPIQVQASLDATRTEGDQLFYIEDTIGTA